MDPKRLDSNLCTVDSKKSALKKSTILDSNFDLTVTGKKVKTERNVVM